MATDMSQPSVGGSKPKTSTIGNELMITGNVTSSGDIRLEGQVQGDIQCAALFLGENSQLEGNAVAEEVVVGGRLIGSVRAVRLTLRASSHVKGDLLYQTLAIEQGAHFDGRSRHSDNPLSTRHGQLECAADQSVGEQPPQPNDRPAITLVAAVPEPGLRHGI
jgi:cytoskeletal protein CcmA (bactofilin family)